MLSVILINRYVLLFVVYLIFPNDVTANKSGNRQYEVAHHETFLDRIKAKFVGPKLYEMDNAYKKSELYELERMYSHNFSSVLAYMKNSYRYVFNRNIPHYCGDHGSYIRDDMCKQVVKKESDKDKFGFHSYRTEDCQQRDVYFQVFKHADLNVEYVDTIERIIINHVRRNQWVFPCHRKYSAQIPYEHILYLAPTRKYTAFVLEECVAPKKDNTVEDEKWKKVTEKTEEEVQRTPSEGITKEKLQRTPTERTTEELPRTPIEGIKGKLQRTVTDRVKDKVQQTVMEGIMEEVKQKVPEGVMKQVNRVIPEEAKKEAKQALTEGIKEGVNRALSEGVNGEAKERLKEGAIHGIKRAVTEGVHGEGREKLKGIINGIKEAAFGEVKEEVKAAETRAVNQEEKEQSKKEIKDEVKRIQTKGVNDEVTQGANEEVHDVLKEEQNGYPSVIRLCLIRHQFLARFYNK